MPDTAVIRLQFEQKVHAAGTVPAGVLWALGLMSVWVSSLALGSKIGNEKIDVAEAAN